MAAAIWGMGTVVIKSTVDEFPPAWIVGVRFTLAGIILGIATAPRISCAFARNKQMCIRDSLYTGRDPELEEGLIFRAFVPTVPAAEPMGRCV